LYCNLVLNSVKQNNYKKVLKFKWQTQDVRALLAFLGLAQDGMMGCEVEKCVGGSNSFVAPELPETSLF
jgi:hypothetical protein